jgi:hypothetical protein
MDATPIMLENAAPIDVAVLSAGNADCGDEIGRKWVTLHEAAAVVAALAGLPPEPIGAELRSFPRRLLDAPHFRRELGRQGLEDIAAIMEPGLAALIAVRTAGRDAAAPAMTLWNEFSASRDALLKLVLPLD